MIFNYSNYTDFLQNSLEDSNLSLRRFAASIAIDHSVLSRILKGERKIPIDIAINLSKEIQLNPIEHEYFMLMVEYEHVVTNKARSLIANELKQIQAQRCLPQVSKDVFESIADVLSFSLLEMIEMKDFEFDVLKIAKLLNTSTIEVERSFENLLKSELIFKDKNSNYIKSKKKNSFKINTGNSALHKYFEEILSKAQEELACGVPEKRIYRTRIASIPKNKRGEICAIVDSFFGKLHNALDMQEDKEDLVCFNFNFFSLLNQESPSQE